mmetsp:Transcript_78741/g.242943  ORF Transcript_78741/g.242943 Transcript_78741/m.242943 type:complete len:290 (-) Transcript_78741:51-920(-)
MQGSAHAPSPGRSVHEGPSCSGAWLAALVASTHTATCRALARGDLLRRGSECGLELLVRVPLHCLGVLEPLDELHLLLLHLCDKGIRARPEQLLLCCAGFVVVTELLKLGKPVFLQPPLGLLLPLLDDVGPVSVGLALCGLAVLLLHQELLRLLLRLDGICRARLLEPGACGVAHGLGFVTVVLILGLRRPDGLPLVLVELLLRSKLLFVLRPQLGDLLSPLPGLLDLLPSLLLLLLEQGDAVGQELRVELRPLPGLLRARQVRLHLAGVDHAALLSGLSLRHGPGQGS